MLVGSDLLIYLWPYAVAHFVWIKNRIPTKAIPDRITPYEVMLGVRPRFGTLVPFGRKVWVKDERPGRTKFDPRSRQFSLVGYTDDPGTIKYWDGRRVLTSRNVIYDNVNPKEQCTNAPTPSRPLTGEKLIPLDTEDELAENPPQIQEDGRPGGAASLEPVDLDCPGGELEQTPRDNVPTENLEPQINADRDIPQPDPVPAQPNRIDQRCSQHNQGQPRLNYRTIATRGLEAARAEAEGHAFNAYTQDPTTYAEAMQSPDARDWFAAMQNEYKQLVDKGVFELTDLPKGRHPIDCRWVYATKCDRDMEVLKRKARMVAKGFSQRPGQDYNETHANVIRPEERASTPL